MRQNIDKLESKLKKLEDALVQKDLQIVDLQLLLKGIPASGKLLPLYKDQITSLEGENKRLKLQNASLFEQIRRGFSQAECDKIRHIINSSARPD